MSRAEEAFERIWIGSSLAWACSGPGPNRTEYVLASRLSELEQIAENAAALLSEGHGGIDEHEGCSDCLALSILRGRA